jgi:hypothetical protein
MIEAKIANQNGTNTAELQKSPKPILLRKGATANISIMQPRNISHKPSAWKEVQAFRSSFFKSICCSIIILLIHILVCNTN